MSCCIWTHWRWNSPCFFGVLQMTVGIILRSQTEGWNRSRLFSGNRMGIGFPMFRLCLGRMSVCSHALGFGMAHCNCHAGTLSKPKGTPGKNKHRKPARLFPFTSSTIISPINTLPLQHLYACFTCSKTGGEYNGIMALWIAGGATLSMRRIWLTSSVNACPWWFSCPLSTTHLYTWRVGGKWTLATLKSCMRFRLRSAQQLHRSDMTAVAILGPDMWWQLKKHKMNSCFWKLCGFKCFSFTGAVTLGVGDEKFTEVSVPFWAMAHHRRSSMVRSELQASDKCGFVTLDVGYCRFCAGILSKWCSMFF